MAEPRQLELDSARKSASTLSATPAAGRRISIFHAADTLPAIMCVLLFAFRLFALAAAALTLLWLSEHFAGVMHYLSFLVRLYCS